MNNNRTVSEVVKILPDMFKEQEKVFFLPKGVSMRPTICEGDSVTLVPVTVPERYDILLYTRADGKAVLHRLIGFDKNGGYIMRGDNCTVKEFDITDSDIVAVVKAVEKNGKIYKTYGFGFKMHSFFTVLYGSIRAKLRKMIRIIVKGR